MNLKAVILAAGEGTRMRPLTQNRPKVMLPVGNKPILEHIMLAVRDAGISEFVFIVGYRSDTIMNHFGVGSRWDVHIEYAEQKKQLGTANAVKVAENLVDGRFLALNGDVLVQSMDLQSLMKEKKDVVLAVKEVDNPQEFGVIEVQGDRVTRVVEKSKSPPSNLANAGIYVFEPEVFDAIDKTLLSSRGEHEITDSLQILIDDGYAVGYQVIDYWFDIG
ncbi:MAG: sugar phosphate nucleotidyltransferase, partial [Methanocellales archaeon]|nr:sugar phosphate nucleotidyltransferase [Methanocellales archaeon]